MSYRVKFTDMAKEDLRGIAFYIAEQSGDKRIAKRLVSELRDARRMLQTLPGSGILPRDRVLRSAGYRFLVHKGYLIFYRTDEQDQIVYVLAVFNGKRDYMRVIRKFV